MSYKVSRKEVNRDGLMKILMKRYQIVLKLNVLTDVWYNPYVESKVYFFVLLDNFHEKKTKNKNKPITNNSSTDCHFIYTWRVGVHVEVIVIDLNSA